MTGLERQFSAKGFAVEMLRIKRQYESDPEAVHDKMDECMCKLLCELGYSEGVQIFEDTEKWYG